MFKVPGCVVYEAADLGLDGVTVPAASGVVDGVFVPWLSLGNITAVSLYCDQGGSGATPYDLFQSHAEFRNSSSLLSQNTGVWTGITNNPRFQPATISKGSMSSGQATGTIVQGEIGKLFSAPMMRFSVRNNHATIAMTSFRLLYVMVHL